jgi:hypothetical protein
VTAALSEFRPPASGWTTDDLDALPEDGVRRGLIDGVVFVSPSPTADHQIIAGRLMVALEESCPEEWVVTQALHAPTGEHASRIQCHEPWPISVPIARLTPRALPPPG